MTHPMIDDETMAAFIDGSLPVAERARVMRLVASDRAVHLAYVEAATLAADLRDAELSPSVRSVATAASARRRLLFVAVPALAVAALALVVLRTRAGTAPDGGALLTGTTLVTEGGAGSLDRALGADWDEPGWPVVRGGGASALPTGLSARIGARVVALELAATANDSVSARRIAGALEALLGTATGAAPIAAQITADPIADRPARALRHLQLRALSADPAAYDAGAWTEAARLALRAGHAEYLRSDGSARAALPAVMHGLETSRDAVRWTDALSALRVLAATRATDQPSLQRLVAAVMSALPSEGNPQRE